MNEEPDEHCHWTEREMEEADYRRDIIKDRQLERAWAERRIARDGRICNCEDAPCCGHYDG